MLGVSKICFSEYIYSVKMDQSEVTEEEKTSTMLQWFLFEINAWTLFVKESWKKFSIVFKLLFKTDNSKKCFLSCKSVY